MKDCRLRLREQSRGRRRRVRGYNRNRGGRGYRGRGGPFREGPPSERYRQLPDTQSPNDQRPSVSWYEPPDSRMGRGAAPGSSAGHQSQQGNGRWQSKGFITKLNVYTHIPTKISARSFGWTPPPTNILFGTAHCSKITKDLPVSTHKLEKVTQRLPAKGQ